MLFELRFAVSIEEILGIGIWVMLLDPVRRSICLKAVIPSLIGAVIGSLIGKNTNLAVVQLSNDTAILTSHPY